VKIQGHLQMFFFKETLFHIFLLQNRKYLQLLYEAHDIVPRNNTVTNKIDIIDISAIKNINRRCPKVLSDFYWQSRRWKNYFFVTNDGKVNW
jgi:hypothetical protein